jgi:hypothetical protein
MRFKVLTITLVLLLALLPLAMQSGVAPPGLPSILVDVEDVDDVQTDPSDYRHISHTAEVTVANFPLGATVKVNASAETWLVEVEPKEFTVASGQTSAHVETINLDIQVPPKASAERAVELQVFANTTNAIGIEYSDTSFANITVRQYYGLRLNSNATMSLDQGKNLTARMRITNAGNGVDNYTISANNEATLSTKGITVEFDDEVHEVGRERTVSVIIEVQAADDAYIGTTDALFTVRSEGDSTKTAQWMVTINVKEGSGGNGGNGGNGDNGDGTEDEGLSQNTMIGIAIVILVIVIMIFFFARSASDVEAEDEDYVVGRDRDAEDDR